MIAKLTTEPKAKKLEKPPMPVSRNDIKQAMRIKCNSVICNQLRKELLSVPLIRLLNTALPVNVNKQFGFIDLHV